jgi:hypothetical protein
VRDPQDEESAHQDHEQDAAGAEGQARELGVECGGLVAPGDLRRRFAADAGHAGERRTVARPLLLRLLQGVVDEAHGRRNRGRYRKTET